MQAKSKRGMKNWRISTNISLYFENGTYTAIVTMGDK